MELVKWQWVSFQNTSTDLDQYILVIRRVLYSNDMSLESPVMERFNATGAVWTRCHAFEMFKLNVDNKIVIDIMLCVQV